MLTPAPGRLRNTLMLVAGVVVVVAVWEVFRIPNAATACYVILFVSRDDRTTTIASATGVLVLVAIAVILAILVTMTTLSFAPLRVAAIAALTFTAMFLSRASKPGKAFFAVGFVTVYALTGSDSVELLGFQPTTVTDTTGTGLPDFLFSPPEEALLHSLLWFLLTAAIPVPVVILINKVFGRDPAALLQDGLDERLAAVMAYCESRPGSAARLEAIARRGSPELVSLAVLAQKEHGKASEPLAANKAAIRAVTRLMLACLAAEALHPGSARPPWTQTLGRRCAVLRKYERVAGPTEAVHDPIGGEAVKAVDDFEAARELKRNPGPGQEAERKQGFWNEDPSEAENIQFALKVTLSVTICYTLNNALAWPGIGTSVVTCFFVALGSLGESGHKMTLRISGCLLGAALGIGAIVLLMPVMTTLPQFLALIAAGTFVAAWIACGSERISYAGWQTALAFYTTLLQGFGPSTDMKQAKDRIIGILLGNVVSYLVLSTVWPVRVDRQITSALGKALSALARLLDGSDKPDDEREAFAIEIGKAQSLLKDGLYEGKPSDVIRVDEALAGGVQALILPASMMAAGQERGYSSELAEWFEAVAVRLKEGRLKKQSFPPTPTLPEGPDGSSMSLSLMQRELEALPFASER